MIHQKSGVLRWITVNTIRHRLSVMNPLLGWLRGRYNAPNLTSPDPFSATHFCYPFIQIWPHSLFFSMKAKTNSWLFLHCFTVWLVLFFTFAIENFDNIWDDLEPVEKNSDFKIINKNNYNIRNRMWQRPKSMNVQICVTRWFLLALNLDCQKWDSTV